MIDKYTFCEEYEYRPIEGYEDLYTIDEYGNVWSIKSNMYLNQFPSHNGYMQVCLCKDGRSINKRVNRLVAIAFIPNPNNYPEVGHDNDDKLNNHYSNLYWTTSLENNNHNGKNQRICKPVRCVETGEIYPSLTAAAEAVGASISSICIALKKKSRCRKLHWEYEVAES